MNAMLMELRTILTLEAETAAELMSPNPVSISETATLREAQALLTEMGFSGAPVIDEAGRPVGVVSRTDLLVHQREAVHYRPTVPERESIPEGFQVEEVDGTLVRDVMTPVVFSVKLDTPAAVVVNQLLELKVHRLFVVDEAGVLTGVISAVDVLRHLEP
jgi:CBS-domain-containing membrane protein